VVEGDEAREAVADAGRRTTSRRELHRHERFAEVSPEVGVIDEEAAADALEADPDATLALLADLVGATDPALRELARRLAGRVAVDLAHAGRARSRGVGRLHRLPASRADGDLDLDASIDEVHRATGEDRPPDAEHLVVGSWQRQATAFCLLVDRSGSMAGERLATAAVAAAAMVLRAPGDCSVVCFSDRAVVVDGQREDRAAEEVVADVLQLRGFGITDVGLALRAAAVQLSRSDAPRRIAVLLSDCRATAGGDPVPHAAGIDEVVILAPEGDAADAAALAAALGARWVETGGPSAVVDRLNEVLDR